VIPAAGAKKQLSKTAVKTSTEAPAPKLKKKAQKRKKRRY
jgi:hypothetical protein